VKTALSVLSEVYEEAEDLAVELGISRSEFYVRAPRIYLDESRADRTTKKLNEVYAVDDHENDEFLTRAGRQLAALDRP